MSYRVEISVSNRAGCRAKRCLDNGVKIQKGELRMGVMVTIKDNQSWQWRHWGCVTPTQVHNWWETAGEDLELIDGYDDLPEDAQTKVQRSLENGHVDDEDWNGDDGFNRYNPANTRQGMYAKTPKKKPVEEEEANSEPESPTKQPAKKRSRVKDEDNDENVKPAKKAKGSKKVVPNDADPANVVKNEPDDDEAPAPKKRQTKSKAVKAEEAEEEEPAEEKPKKARAKKVKPEAATAVDVPKKGRSKKAKTVQEPEEEPEEEAEEDPAPEPKPKPKRKGRKAAA